MSFKSIGGGRIGAWLAALLLAACGGGGGGGGATAVAKFTVGVSVSGLPSGSSIVLQDNGGDNLTVSANGAASFATGIANGAAYAVTISTPPAGQTCSVTNGAGTVAGANVTGVAVACVATRHFAYVAACGGAFEMITISNGSLSAYTIDESSGLLSPISGATYVSELNPAQMSSTVVDPSGRFVYMTAQVYVGPGEILGYKIDPSSGVLSPMSSVALEPLIGGYMAPSPAAIALTPNGRYAYVANAGGNNLSLYAVDATTGVLTSVSGTFATDSRPDAVAVSPNGNFVFATNFASSDVSVFTINSATGALTPVAGSPFAAGTGPNAIAVSQNGNFVYTANSGSNNISAFAINAATGVLTPVAGSPFAAGNGPNSLTIAPNGNFAYVANVGSGNISVYRLNATSGVPTPIAGSPIAAGAVPYTVTFDPSGKFAYTTNPGVPSTGEFGSSSIDGNVSTYSVNSGTGVLTPVGSPISTGSQTCSMAFR